MVTRSIKSAERTLALFELFSRQQAPFTVGETSHQLNIPQASASMLLRNLTDLGYLEYNRDNRTFMPSIRVALLGAWIDRRFEAAGSIGTKLSELQQQTSLTAFIGIQNGGQAQYLLSQSSQEPGRLVVMSGEFRSLTQSAMGQALLALMPEEKARSWIRRCNAEALSAADVVSERACVDEINRVRRRGFAETSGRITPGVGAIAMTFKSPMGDQPLAVGVGGQLSLLHKERDKLVLLIGEFASTFNNIAN
jgi:DNA-binding IclR family transcriptional regulator